jgi:hypothetical protein
MLKYEILYAYFIETSLINETALTKSAFAKFVRIGAFTTTLKEAGLSLFCEDLDYLNILLDKLKVLIFLF